MCQKNRRRSKRIDISIPIKFRINEFLSRSKRPSKANPTITGEIIDLSSGGLSFLTGVPSILYFDAGDHIRSQFMIGEISFEVTSLILRIDKSRSLVGKEIFYVAVRFVDLEEGGAALIEKYVKECEK